MIAREQRRRPGGMDEESSKRDLSLWVPKTELGRRVKAGEIKTIHELLTMSIPIKEVEIIDALLPDLTEEIISVGRVQRVTDSGRRTRFKVVMVVGNRDGYVGMGQAKGKESGPTIRKAIERAKMGIREIKRGCGSWECGCRTPHTVPFSVSGSAGSVRVTLSPAPKGTGLVSGAVAKKLLALSGVKDVWVHTEGHPRTSVNFASAILEALVNTNKMKIAEADVSSLGIVEGLSIIKEDGKAEEAEQAQSS